MAAVDQTQVNSYQEKLLEAMNMVSTQLISSIPYDKTITCTITDDTNAKEGKYTVSQDGNITFDAYSTDTGLKKNDVVYVTIPEGDYDNQKIIQGKKTSDSEKPFVFTTPLDTMLGLTGNLLQGPEGEPDKYRVKILNSETNKEEYTKPSLIANNLYTTKLETIKDPETDKDIEKEVIINPKAQFVKLYERTGMSETGYTRLGIKADFMSWLPEAQKGSYGIRVTLKDNLNTTTLDDRSVAHVQQTKMLWLDVSDMYGNPYNFESYYSQEKVCPITELNTITDIIVEFYQIAGSFYDIDNNPLRVIDAQDRPTKEELKEGQSVPIEWQYTTNYGYNLFVDNIEIEFGYDVSEITDELIVPVINDSMTYSHFREGEANKKTIDLRWVHQFEDGPRVVRPERDFDKSKETATIADCEIRWYRYCLGAAAADEYSGVYWKRLVVSSQDGKYYLSDWDGTTKPVYQLDADGNKIKNNETDEYIIIGKVPDYKETQALENVVFTPDVSYQTEQIKAIVFLDGVAIRGPVITFRNEEDKTGEIVDNFVNALSIKCNDGTDGNYLIYNEAGNILNYADAQIERKLQCTFAEKGAEARSNLLLDGKKLDTISWKIPNDSSMIQLQGLKRKMVKAEDGTESEKEYYVIYKKVPNLDSEDETELVKTSVEFEVLEGDDNLEAPVYKTKDYYILQKDATFDSEYNKIYYPTYKINGQYSQYTMNNTIACTVQKDRIIYNAEQEMVFGVSGTMGSDYSIVIRFVEGHNAVIIGDADTNYSLEVKMYDANNKPVQLNSDIGIQWSWFKPGGDSLSDNISFGNDTQSSVVELKVKPLGKGEGYFDETKLNTDVYIAQVTVGSNKLTTYFPIPLKVREEFSHIEGATEVIYLSNGHPEYYKGDYKLYMITTDKDDVESTQAVETEKVKWKIFGGDFDLEKEITFRGDLYYQEGEDASTGSSGKEGLRPLGVYTEGVKNYGIICYYDGSPVWYQPILVIRNNYPSRIINKWDGKTLQIDKATGTILSTAIAAGRKDTDTNTFTGTMIGDWSSTSSDGSVTEATGVYGFHKGAMAYAFMDNGKAFIGKSGEGRIEFDCSSNGAIIKHPTNMCIDLTSGQIDATHFALIAGSEEKRVVLQTSTDGEIRSEIEEDKPLQIGNHFNVSWTGHMTAASADIGAWHILPTDSYRSSGSDDDSDSGSSSGTKISAGSIYSDEDASQDWEAIILDPVLNTVTGGKFVASILEAKDENIKLGGYINVYPLPTNSDGEIDYSEEGAGTLGYITSSFGDGINEGPGIGMTASGSYFESGISKSGEACIKATYRNAGMSYNGSYFSLSENAAVLNFDGGSTLQFSNNGINMTNENGGRLIAEGDHIGMGFDDSYITLYSDRTDLYDCSQINLGIRTGEGKTLVPYLLIGSSASDVASIHLDGEVVYLQKNTLVKGCTLTIGEETYDDTYYLVVAGTEASVNSAWFKKNVLIGGNLNIETNLDVSGNTTITGTTTSTGLITAQSGITSEGDITASNYTVSAYQFSGSLFSGGDFTTDGTMTATSFEGGTYSGAVDGTSVNADTSLTCTGDVDFRGASNQYGIQAQFA